MDYSFICTFCNKSFINKYNLQRHQNTSKKCLNVQDKKEEEYLEFDCMYCSKLCSSKCNLESHMKNCKAKLSINIKDTSNKYENLFKEYENLKKKFEEVERQKNFFEIKFMTEEENNKKLAEIYKKLEDKYDAILSNYQELTSKAIENTGNKTTNNIINNKNRIIQNLQPLTREHMQEQIQHLTFNNVKNGAHGIAHFASNYTFKDRIVCSDVSRLNFVFKNEDDVIIKDPEGVEITKRFIEINREELLRLLEEYFNYIVIELEKDLDAVEYRYWADRREEVIATRSAIRKGNVQDNKEYYDEFRKNFLSALSKLVPR